jgi:Domain of unknown function (DUF4395)
VVPSTVFTAASPATPAAGPPRLVPGPPKRFAQALGATMSTSACLLAFAVNQPGVARVVCGAITAGALLESALGLCVGCTIFAGLMRLGVIPQSVCRRCANITFRPGPHAL